MVVFGGAVGGGGLADDNLYALDLKNGEDVACWLVKILKYKKVNFCCRKYPGSEVRALYGIHKAVSVSSWREHGYGTGVGCLEFEFRESAV